MSGEELPEGWVNTTLDGVLSTLEGGTKIDQGWSPQCEAHPAPDEAWGVLKTTSIQPGSFVDVHNKALRSTDMPRSDIEVQAGDVVITCAGPRNRCGIAALVRRTRPRLMLSGKMYRFRPRSDVVDARFLEAFLLAPGTAGPIDKIKTGSSDNGMNLTQARFLSLAVTVPPLPEQKRIVARLDALQTRSRAAREALAEVPALLDTFRQSVLAAAFRGDLTAEWRAKNPDVEPASKLLERIRAERKKRWANPKKKYVEPEPVDDSELPELPEGWVWANLGTLFYIGVGATPSRKEPAYWSDGDIPWVSSGEVGFCHITETRERITAAGLRNTSTEVHQPGTVLIGMIGEGRTRGQAAILDIQACNNQNCAAIRVSETEVPPEYVYRYLHGQYELTRTLGSGNNQPALNKSRVQAMVIPMAPLAEQFAIVEAIGGTMGRTDRIGDDLSSMLTDLDTLDQSILARAFRGDLVDQDPNDEPAEALLARIKGGPGSTGAARPLGPDLTHRRSRRSVNVVGRS